MRTVWLVGSGEYSDYGIEAIFSTKEKADAAVAENRSRKTYSQWHDPVEFVLDAETGSKWFDPTYSCHMNLESGEIIEERVYQNPSFMHKRGNADDIGGYVWSHSPISAAHARKLAVEFRQKWLRKQVEP